MIEREELLSIVPHRGKMLLLNRVREYNTKELSIEAEYSITEDGLFFDSDAAGVPAWVGFEFIAQAVSALIGIRYRENGEPPKIGFILSVSQMRIGLPFFKTGSIIAIKANIIESVDSLYIFKGEIFIEGVKVLEGKLTVMDVDDDQVSIIKKETDSIE